MMPWASNRRVIMVVALLMGIVTAKATPAYAQTVHYGDGPPPGTDPFCGISISVASWDVKKNAESATSDRLLAAMYTQGKKLSGRLVLFTDTQALSVNVPPLMTFKLSTENVTSEFIIALPKAMRVNHAYVESYSQDGAPEVQCAVEPVKLGQFDYATIGLTKPDPASIKHFFTFPATFKERLPVTNCGAPDRDAIVTHAVQPDGIENLDKTRTAVVAVYVDTTGHIAKTYLTQSSGIDVTDEQAQAAAIRSTYQPALMHCMPVNAAYLFTAEFDQ
jgi:hypothetical protein